MHRSAFSTDDDRASERASSQAAARAAAAPLTEALAASARRYFFRVASVICLAGAPLTLLLPPSGLVHAGWLGAMFVLLGIAAALALRLPAHRQPAALSAFIALDSVALAVLAFTHRASVGDAALGLFAALACVSFAGAGRRAGLRVAALQGVLLAALHAVWWPDDAAQVSAHLARLALHGINVVAGTAAGLLIARSLVRHMRTAAERERRFRRLLALAADVYWETDRQHRLHTVADPGREHASADTLSARELRQAQRAQEARMAGREPWTMPGFSCDADVLDRLRADFEAHETVHEVPVRWSRGGEVRHWLVSGAPRFDEQGRFAGYWGVARDVSAAHAAEAALRATEAAVRRSEAMLSHLVATTPDLVAVSELASGRYTMVNPAFERDIGWTAAEATGRTSSELGTWWSREDRPAFMQALQESGRVYNMPAAFRTRSGTRIEMSMSAALFTMDGREFVVTSARDLSTSERQRLEREAILANASVGIAVTREQRFVLANRHFEDMLGWPAGELLGQPGRVAWPDDAAHADIGRRFAAALGRGERVEFEATMVRKDGRGFLAHLRAHAVDPVRPQDGGTVWITEDITARREAELALQEARSAAESASRAKSRFLANTSHELRTPLNGIVGLASLARNPGLDAAVRERYLEQIVDSARSLTAIISDILDLSKIEAGRLELERSTFDLGELLRTLQQTCAPQAAARGLALHLELDAGVRADVVGDALRLRQVIGNFLSNALKFTAQGEITVRAWRCVGDEREVGSTRLGVPGGDGERVRVEVHDTGPGIEPAALARLFQPFSQADESTTRRFGGTGLGLSISRELATLMGGEVGVASESGRGSCFWLELPLPEAQLPQAPSAMAAVPAAGGSLQGMRVLMVEDNQVNMIIAVAMLEGWGVEVEQTGDGQQAVQALQRAQATGRLPDAVLMDVQMPHMSGHEATRALRALPGLAGLPVIALTAAALVDERERSRAAGMDDFLTKPIDPERLRAALLRWRHAAAPLRAGTGA